MSLAVSSARVQLDTLVFPIRSVWTSTNAAVPTHAASTQNASTSSARSNVSVQMDSLGKATCFAKVSRVSDWSAMMWFLFCSWSCLRIDLFTCSALSLFLCLEHQQSGEWNNWVSSPVVLCMNFQSARGERQRDLRMVRASLFPNTFRFVSCFFSHLSLFWPKITSDTKLVFTSL